MRRAGCARPMPNWAVSVCVSSWLLLLVIHKLPRADLRHLDEAVNQVVPVADHAGFKRFCLRQRQTDKGVVRVVELALAVEKTSIDFMTVRTFAYRGGGGCGLFRRGLGLDRSERDESAEQENGGGEKYADDEVEADAMVRHVPSCCWP